MKKIITLIIVVALVGTFSSPCFSATKTNKQIAKEWAKQHYPTYKIVFVKEFDKRIDARKGKHTVYIEKIISHSDGGKHGTDEYGFYIAYNKKVKKGKKVVSYIIYNPKTNYCDDVVAVIDNKKVR